MPDRVQVDLLENLPPGSRRAYVLGDRRVAVFNVEGALHAVDDRCPHRGASLGRGTVEAGLVSCPLHGWKFDVATGQGVTEPGVRLLRHEAFVTDGAVFVELADDGGQAPQESDGIHRYLVRYGAMGWVGLFGSVEPVECGHGDRILVHTRRGLEAGELLSRAGADAQFAEGSRPCGELLRRLTAEDERQERSVCEAPLELFDDCRRHLAERGLAVEVIDGERLFDGETVVLYYLGEAAPALDPLAAELTERHAAQVLFEPVIEPEPARGGCGSGCGSCSH